jgi:hypothetical protein
MKPVWNLKPFLKQKTSRNNPEYLVSKYTYFNEFVRFVLNNHQLKPVLYS